MADPESRRRLTQNGSANFSARPWQVPKKSRWQVVAASVLLAVWIVFLVTMAVYN